MNFMCLFFILIESFVVYLKFKTKANCEFIITIFNLKINKSSFYKINS